MTMTSPLLRAALALTLGLLPLSAQTPASTQKPQRAWAHLAEQLKLTEDQKSQIQVIRARHANAVKDLKQEAAVARRAFHEAFRKPETTAAQLRSLHSAMQDKEFDLMMNRRALDSEIHAVLTPEQRIEWDKVQAYRQGMRHGRKGQGA
jgi:Spy/CpxP family protein refolding chaperone